MKTATIVALGAGAAAVVGGVVVVQKIRKTNADKLEFEQAVKSVQIEQIAPPIESVSFKSVKPKIKPLQSIEPRGWLGQLIEHGGRCINFSVQYMTSKKYGDHWHLLPQLLASRDNWGNMHADWKRKTLMVNRFAEWPCPAFPRCQPMFVSYDADRSANQWGKNGGTAEQWLSVISEIKKGHAFKHVSGLVDGGRASEMEMYGVMGTILHPTTDPTSAPIPKLSTNSDGILSVSIEGHSHNVFPALNTIRWVQQSMGNTHLVKDKGLEMTPIAIMAAAGPGATTRALKVPSYFRMNDQRMHTWLDRISRWYYNAQWLVWAGEMLRLHCPDTRAKSAPGWWRMHCASWAIGVPTFSQQKSREVYYNREATLNTSYIPPEKLPYYISHPEASRDLTEREIEMILKLVVHHTPCPGTEGFTGEQITSPSAKRTLCDIPDEAGSMQPISSFLGEDNNCWWPEYSCTYWASKSSSFQWGRDVLMPVVNAIASIASSAAGSAVSAAANAATQVVEKIVLKVCTTMIQALGRMAQGNKPFNAGDIVGAVGDALNMSGVADAIDLKQIPDGLWSALKNAGEALPKISGVDWEEMKNSLLSAQSQLSNLRDNLHWDYLDQAYGGLGLGGAEQDAFDHNPIS